MFDIIMFGDWGEDIDDETATYFLNGYFNNIEKKIAYVCVGGEIPSYKRKARLQHLIPGVANKVFTIEEFVTDIMYYEETNKFCKILQTAPIADNMINDVKIIVDYAKPYDYVLQGELGKTMNTKKGFTETATYFIQNSNKYTCVTNPYPLYTYNNSLMFGHKLSDEILKTAFKFMIGRPLPSAFTIHLVGNNGANFKLNKSVYENITGNSIYYNIPSQKNINFAKEYCMKVNFDNPFAITKMKDFNESVYIYETNLALMLQCCEDLFGIDELMYSNTVSSIYESTDYKNSSLYKCFNNFKNKILKFPDIPLIPAYDLKAAYVLVENNHHENITIDEIMISCNDKLKRILNILAILYLCVFITLCVLYF